jgi:mRNA-degrading endonuclease RelE of RelBE toxin-antitoxin system
MLYIDKNLFEAWMERVLERIEMLDRKIEKLSNKKSQLNGETLLDNQDLCLLLKVSNRSLQRYRSSGILPYRRIQQKIYYLESDVHKFISKEFVYKKKK